MSNCILSGAVKIFSAINRTLAKAACVDVGEIGKSDFAVLQVAMMVSAIDGDVRDEELAAFTSLAKKCSGYTPESANAALNAGVRLAGYLMLQSKRLTEKALIAEFVNEAMSVLSNDFIAGRSENMRQAFVTWLSMAFADGEYSSVERRALGLLRERIESEVEELNEHDKKVLRSLSPTRAIAYGDASCQRRKAPTEAFVKNAAKYLARMNDDAQTAQATQDLKDLVLNG